MRKTIVWTPVTQSSKLTSTPGKLTSIIFVPVPTFETAVQTLQTDADLYDELTTMSMSMLTTEKYFEKITESKSTDGNNLIVTFETEKTYSPDYSPDYTSHRPMWQIELPFPTRKPNQRPYQHVAFVPRNKKIMKFLKKKTTWTYLMIIILFLVAVGFGIYKLFDTPKRLITTVWTTMSDIKIETETTATELFTTESVLVMQSSSILYVFLIVVITTMLLTLAFFLVFQKKHNRSKVVTRSVSKDTKRSESISFKTKKSNENKIENSINIKLSPEIEKLMDETESVANIIDLMIDEQSNKNNSNTNKTNDLPNVDVSSSSKTKILIEKKKSKFKTLFENFN